MKRIPAIESSNLITQRLFEYEKLLPEYKLAKSLIEQRLKKKMTQEEVAKKAGMPQSTISRIEGLTHGLPKLSTLKKIANALDAQIVIKLL